MSAKLVAEEGFLKELVLSFDDGDHWIIGRDPDSCQLLVEDPSASRKHVLCRKTPDGITAENLSKTNPIQINDEPVEQPRLLHNGDLVKIGDSLFRFYAEAAAHLFEDQTTVNPPQEHQTTPFVRNEKEDEDHSMLEDEALGQGELAKINFGLVETGRWLLKIVSGPNNGAEFSMETGKSYLVGTDPNSCDIVMYDTSVSRQHARITISDEEHLFIEDLKSKNGTRIEGDVVKGGKYPLPLNTLVTIGTSSFVVYDREGEMQTIISPLLPAIVKVLQKEEPKEASEAVTKKEDSPPPPPAPPPPEQKKPPKVGTFILTGILVGLFAVVGLAVESLFLSAPVVQENSIDTQKILSDALSPFPGVKFSFNQTTGRLLLVGHVLTATDKSQLQYNLQGFPFIKDIDDSGVIIDEYVWSEVNQVLARNPSWKGIIVHSPSPGSFVVSGYLQSRQQGEQVWDYLTRNFPYLDLLENKIVVEEDVIVAAQNALHSKGFPAVKVEMNAGEVTLTGGIPTGSKTQFDIAVDQLRDIPGIRAIRNLVSEKAPSEAVINISDRYVITGTSQVEGGLQNVIINGRILSTGDVLDGMRITKITSTYVLLEKDGVAYRIDMTR